MEIDALPLDSFFLETPNQSSNNLDMIIKKLTIYDYRSIFFLLMDYIGPQDFLAIVNRDKEFLKNEFLMKYYGFHNKDALLVELFGTMQRFDLLKIQGTCKHLYFNDCGTFNQIDKLWKCLFTVCECLTDSHVELLKDKLFPDSRTFTVNSAEELLCKAYLEKKFDRQNLKSLARVFRDFHRDCFNKIEAYESCEKLNYYPVRRPSSNSPCGIAIIFNHEDFKPSSTGQIRFPPRKESRLDAEALKALWESFGFRTTIYNNCSDIEVKKIFCSVAKLDHSSFDVFIACYLSHGDEGVVYASNCKPVLLTHLIEIMANQCQSLVNKPKLFFVQACQGQQVQQGIGNPVHTISSDSVTQPLHHKSLMKTPLNSDILIMTSSFPGFVSFRPMGGNSWFIGALVETISRFGEELTMQSIVPKVVNLVCERMGVAKLTEEIYTNCKQVPTSMQTLKKELKLKKMI